MRMNEFAGMIAFNDKILDNHRIGYIQVPS